jgi:MYXO-CTERM domain-containing protein
MHTVQDSFTHTYRTDDHRSIVEVHNWIEDVTGDRRTDRDGPPHGEDIDECRCSRAWMLDLKDANHQASVDLLAVASMSGTRVEREAALDAFLDAWMNHVPGCTADNGYCTSPDPGDRFTRPCGGCSIGDPTGGTRGGGAILAVLVVVGLLAARRRS